MNRYATGACVLAVLGLALAGCVEKKMLIRSEPPGAPVWVDEAPVGTTPVDYRFEHYGRRRIRIGPIRDASDKATHLMTERVVEIEPPWYEKFPVDFFYEVLWPGLIVDEHLVEMKLTPAAQQPTPTGQQRAKEVLGEAEQFRQKAMETIPEAGQ